MGGSPKKRYAEAPSLRKKRVPGARQQTFAGLGPERAAEGWGDPR